VVGAVLAAHNVSALAARANVTSHPSFRPLGKGFKGSMEIMVASFLSQSKRQLKQRTDHAIAPCFAPCFASA
jgi:hypothetical protein